MAVERATGSAARVGIGSRADAAGALQRSLAEARHALRLASAERPVVRWDMLAGHRLLMDLQPPEIADAFERTLLAPLDAHDARRGTDLVRTVEVFLDAAGHWKPAADVLHVHVNTLRHRLDRVAALTGRDLAQMGDRVDFYLALQVRRSRAGRR
jgi:DNA-binding PucR family transcriptional regulator